MRTENSKHGVVSILLVFALVFSMVTISAPLASAGNWVNNPEPGGTTIDVAAGDTFLIRHVLEWNQAENGAYTVTIAWDCYDNNADENFTPVDNSAYFISGDHIGESIRAEAVLSWGPSPDFPGSTRYVWAVSCPADDKDPRDGEFNVDITLGAYGVGGVPHKQTDSHPIIWQYAGVQVIEKSMVSWDREIITIDVAGVGVTVDITPPSDNGWTNDVLTYTVTVNNTGELADNYNLILTDTADPDWTMSISPGILSIPGSSSDTATLSVTVGAGSDTITVTADGVYADGSDTCTATQLIGPRVDVEVSPDYQEDLPGEDLCYTVIITNIGTVSDNYTVVITDDAGWGLPGPPLTPTVDLFFSEYIEGGSNNKAIEIYNGTGAPVDLSAYKLGLWTNGYVEEDGYPYEHVLSGTLASGDVWVGCHKDADAAIKAVADWIDTAVYPAPVVINWNGDDGITLRMVSDNSVVDAIGEYNIDPGTSWPGGGKDQTQVRKCTILQGDDNFDNTDPFTFATEWDNYAKDTFDYIGAHQTCVYDNDNAMIVSLDPGETYEFTVCVTIPIDAVVCTVDNVTVTATSEVNPSVSDSETVQAHVAALVEVDVEPIDPSHQDVAPNRAACFEVTITNTGEEADNFEVVLSDTEGWDPRFVMVYQTLPTDDTHITEGDPDGVPYGGTSYNMYNGWDATYLSERPYLKFDISEIPLDAKICGATLNANSKYGPSAPGYIDTYHLVDAMSVTDDSWTESTLTWSNAPPVGDVLDTENYQGDYWVGEYKWYSWNVKSWVNEQWHGDKVVSIALVSQEEGGPDNSAGWFYTKDAYSRLPYLEVYYQPGDTNTKTVELDIGESVTLAFGVIVPAWAVPSTTDTITVTATSVSEPEVSDSEDVTVHAKSTLRIVEATVEGLTSQETYKDPLTYVVKIRNAGQIADMYKLTAYDTEGWPLYVEPQEIYLKPSHSAQAVLSVTIPYQTPGSTTDDITVWIQGKLATGTKTDLDNSQTRVYVQARAEEIYGVDVEVYPSIHQTGHPSSRLTWLVTVTNTGNMPDTYDLKLSQNVWDETSKSPYPEWGPELDQTEVALEAGEEDSILLNLDVPADLRTGVHNEILVEAVAVSEMAYDNASVTAQVLEQKPRVPQGEIQLQAVAGIVAIDIWPTYYDFGVFDEMDIKATYETQPNYFTIRNVGNVDVDVSIVGTDAVSKPGEPAAKWTLGDGFVGVDMYALWWTEENTVTKEEKILTDKLVPSEETYFDLKIQAPSTFTTPAKMWMKVAITARKIHY